MQKTKRFWKGSFPKTLGTLLGNLGIITAINTKDGKVLLEIDFGEQESAEDMAKTLTLTAVQPTGSA